jgi:hypothetical protein
MGQSGMVAASVDLENMFRKRGREVEHSFLYILSPLRFLERKQVKSAWERSSRGRPVSRSTEDEGEEAARVLKLCEDDEVVWEVRLHHASR